MTINYVMLFDQIGKALKIADDIMAAAKTDVPADVEAFQLELQDLGEPAEEAAIESGISSALSSWQSSCGSAVSSLVGVPVSRLIVTTVRLDQVQLNRTISTALAYLIAQMEDEGETLDACVPGYSVVYGEGGSSSGAPGDNVGSGVIVLSTKRPDGRVNEFILAETITAVIRAVGSDGTATWRLTGQEAVGELNANWPAGSAMNRNLTSYVASSGSNLIPGGDFEDDDTSVLNLPYQWVLATGTLNTDVYLTAVETQTVTVNGTPTGGFYTLTFTNRDGISYTTDALAYNATGAAVQTALQELPGLGQVTVSSTGTSPNMTHAVTFNDVPEPATLTSTSGLTGGSPTITHAVTQEGSPWVCRGGRSLQLVGDGATLTDLYIPLELSASRQYAVCIWAMVDVVPAAGELTIELIDSIGGTVVADDAGTDNAFTVDCTALLGHFTAQTDSFRTPTNMPSKVYLRVRFSTALSSGSSVFLDEFCMVPMSELYTSGLYAAAFSGADDFLEEDEATITVTNDRAGAVHEWLARVLGFRAKRILLPSVDDGSETISDSVIS